MEKRGHSMKIVERASAYLEILRTRRYSPNSVEVYARAIMDFIGFAEGLGRTNVRDITSGDLVQYRLFIKGRGLADSSIQVYLRAVRRFFAHLEETQVIFVNPTAGQEIFRSSQVLMPVPTEEEMRILLRGPNVSTPIGVRNRAILETAYGTGARRQELTDMEVKSLNLADGTARIMGKGSRERMVPLGDEAVRWLKRYQSKVRPGLLAGQENPHLWIGRDGRKMTSCAIQAIVDRCRKDEGISTHITLHSIRRACATHMLRRGASPVTIQLLLGHATMRHLASYLRLNIGDLQKVHSESRVGE